MLIEVVLGSVALVFLAFYLHNRNCFQLREKMGLSGPKPSIVFGNLIQMGCEMKKNGMLMAKVFVKWADDYGETFGYYSGRELFVVTKNLELIQGVLVRRFDCFTDRMKMPFISGVFSESLLVVEHSKWRYLRSKLSPTFTTGKIKKMTSTVCDKIDKVLDRLDFHVDKGDSFDIFDIYKGMTLDVIAKVAFGIDSNCISNPDDPFLNNTRQFFNEQPSPNKNISVMLGVLFPEIGPLFAYYWSKTADQGKAEKWLFDLLLNVIKDRAQTHDPNSNYFDTLKLLLDQSVTADENGRQMTHWEIANNCFVFLLAGYETTSTALAFTTWLLAKHQDKQDVLAKELNENLENVPESEWYSTVMKLPYLDAVFHEATRMYPPITFFVNRTCTENCEIEGVKFEKGVQFGVNVVSVHYDPETWPEPEKFLPERFVDAKNGYHPMSWLPFGAGPRNCIGLRFAEMEYKFALTKIMMKYKIVFGPGSQDPLTIKNDGVMQTTEKVVVCVEKR